MKQIHFIIASLIVGIALHANAGPQTYTLPNGKVVLQISLDEKERLFAKLDFTNIVSHGPVTRDSTGTKLFTWVETGLKNNPVRELRTQQLVVVTVKGAHIKPWHFPANERVTDDEEVAVWQHTKPEYIWEVRGGETLPKGCNLADTSGEWIAIESQGRFPWLAKLNTPNIVAAEFRASPGLISIFANGRAVHAFTRSGWRNDDGPMKYLVYDFAKDSSKPIKEMILPWARIALEMDPETGQAIINDNNKFWGRTWLLDLNIGKRKSISTSDWTLIVKKEVAQKWIELTKP